MLNSREKRTLCCDELKHYGLRQQYVLMYLCIKINVYNRYGFFFLKINNMNNQVKNDRVIIQNKLICYC